MSSGSQMLREIHEQPVAVARTIEAAAGAVAALAADIERRAIANVVLVARGTSDHAAIYARYLLEGRCGLLAGLAAPSLYTTYRAPVDLSRSLVLAVSQSGEVPEIVESVRYAASRGALTAGLTNHPGSTLSRHVRHALATAAGEERSVAATKTFTAQLTVVAMLAAALGQTAVAADLEALPAALDRTIGLAQAGLAAVDVLAGARSAVCVARGFAYCVALEAALKLKEASGVWAEGFSSADLRHGPAAAADGLPALVFHAGGPFASDLDAIEADLAARGSPVISIGPGRTVETASGLGEDVTVILLAVPAQLAAERLARLRGRDPDRPPHLSKVTATR